VGSRAVHFVKENAGGLPSVLSSLRLVVGLVDVGERVNIRDAAAAYADA
jgi:hypothetical protein